MSPSPSIPYYQCACHIVRHTFASPTGLMLKVFVSIGALFCPLCVVAGIDTANPRCDKGQRMHPRPYLAPRAPRSCARYHTCVPRAYLCPSTLVLALLERLLEMVCGLRGAHGACAVRCVHASPRTCARTVAAVGTAAARARCVCLSARNAFVLYLARGPCCGDWGTLTLGLSYVATASARAPGEVLAVASVAAGSCDGCTDITRRRRIPQQCHQASQRGTFAGVFEHVWSCVRGVCVRQMEPLPCVLPPAECALSKGFPSYTLSLCLHPRGSCCEVLFTVVGCVMNAPLGLSRLLCSRLRPSRPHLTGQPPPRPPPPPPPRRPRRMHRPQLPHLGLGTDVSRAVNPRRTTVCAVRHNCIAAVCAGLRCVHLRVVRVCDCSHVHVLGCDTCTGLSFGAPITILLVDIDCSALLPPFHT